MAITMVGKYNVIENGTLDNYIVSTDAGTGSSYTTYSYYTTAYTTASNIIYDNYQNNLYGTGGGAYNKTYKLTTTTDNITYWNDSTAGTITTDTVLRQIDSGTIYMTSNYPYYINYSPIVDKKQLLRDRLAGNFRDLRVIKVPKGTPEEEKARELLREMVSSKEFREYLTKGRLTVIGKTNLRYVIKPGHQMVDVIAKDKNGKYRIVERLCLVHRDMKIPPTDSVIMRKLMIEHDEFAFRSLANVHKVADHREFDQNQIAALTRQVA